MLGSAGELAQGCSTGKTTLLQLLGTLDRPDAGSIFFEGRELVTLGDGALAELRLRAFGFVFQQFNLIPTLSAIENVEAALAPAGRDDAESRARALANEPRVILADEPTGNLDTKTGSEVIDVLAGLGARHGTTIIVATHDTTLAARAPRRIAMRDGSLLEPTLA